MRTEEVILAILIVVGLVATVVGGWLIHPGLGILIFGLISIGLSLAAAETIL